MSGGHWCRAANRDRDSLFLCAGGPDEADTAQESDEPDPGEEAGQAEAQQEGGGGDAADAQVGDQRVGRAGPDLLAGRSLDRVGPVEAGPVAAFGGELVLPAA